MQYGARFNEFQAKTMQYCDQHIQDGDPKSEMVALNISSLCTMSINCPIKIETERAQQTSLLYNR